MFIEQPPEFFRKLYPGAVWRMDPNEKAVYLTFDDGPIPEVTPWVLGLLDKHIMFTVYPSSRIIIGDNSGISSACLWASTSITIGNYVKIGGDCIIMDTDAHSLNFNIRRSIEKNEQGYRVDGLAAATAPIIIEDDVLIGTRCIILKGVIIGARTVIGSGSVVTKSIPADCIAAGNPCRVIKYIER